MKRRAFIASIAAFPILVKAQPYFDAAMLLQKPSAAGTPGPTPDLAWLKTQDGSGTAVTDSVGGHEGTLSGASPPTWVTGQDTVAGHALAFGGVTAFVSLASPPVFGNRTAGSIVIWFKRSGTILATEVIYGEGNSGTNTQFLLIGLNTSGNIVAQLKDDASTTSTITSVGAFNDGLWHQAALVVISKSSIQLYVDTTLVGTDSTTRGTTTINQVTMGSLNRLANALFYGGTAADLKVYSTAITSTDVTNLFNAGTP